MFGLGLPEIVVIILAIGVLIFGGKKITDLSRSLGRASGEFKKGKQDIERELKDAQESVVGEETITENTTSETSSEPKK